MLKEMFINFVRSYLVPPNKAARIKCVRLTDAAIIPTKAHTGLYEDAAYDIYSPEAFTLAPGERKLVDSQIVLIIPGGFWVKLRERSGLANKGIHVMGGVIDSGYLGAIKVILYNSSNVAVDFPTDKAICQFTVEKLIPSSITEVSKDAIVKETQKRTRGIKGFGSSDVKPN